MTGAAGYIFSTASSTGYARTAAAGQRCVRIAARAPSWPVIGFIIHAPGLKPPPLGGKLSA